MSEPLDLGIVTTVHNYGEYLDDWASSIIALRTYRPAVVAILEHGSTDHGSYGLALEAARKLEAAGLEVMFEAQAERLNFGAARNRAVELAGAVEWVQHFDADDMLMEHALEDFAKLKDQADVVSFGYERCGDLAAGPRQRAKLYRQHQGEGTLRDPTPSSGVSPFRRVLWERAPYVVDQEGGWDTALWLGFARLNARFVPTRRPVFWYRQHADSIFNTRRLSAWPTQLVGCKLQSRRRGDAGVAFLVPRSTEEAPERETAWQWVQAYYRHHFPDWPIVEGFGSARAWSKGEALNEALGKTTARTLAVLDADVVILPEALRRAVAQVENGTAPWVVPHQMVYRLDRASTLAFLNEVPTGLPQWEMAGDGLVRPPYQGLAGGGVFVIQRAAYVATRGVPRCFQGWGSEDEAAAVIFDTLLGSHTRYDYPLVHLFHPPQPTKERHQALSNRALFSRYREASGQSDRMWALVANPAGPYLTEANRHLERATRQAQTRAHLAESFESIRLARQAERTRQRKTAMHDRTPPRTLIPGHALQAENKFQPPRDGPIVSAGEIKAAELAGKLSSTSLTKKRFETYGALNLAAYYGLVDADFEGLQVSGRINDHAVRAVIRQKGLGK